MSTATLNQFYQEVVSNPTLQQHFQSVNSPEEIVKIAVDLSQEKGYNFTSQEVEDWLKSHSSNGENSELKDEELEAVAGGWGMTPDNLFNLGFIDEKKKNELNNSKPK